MFVAEITQGLSAQPTEVSLSAWVRLGLAGRGLVLSKELCRQSSDATAQAGAQALEPCF